LEKPAASIFSIWDEDEGNRFFHSIVMIYQTICLHVPEVTSMTTSNFTLNIGQCNRKFTSLRNWGQVKCKRKILFPFLPSVYKTVFSTIY
jgi:hypothetical protein